MWYNEWVPTQQDTIYKLIEHGKLIDLGHYVINCGIMLDCLHGEIKHNGKLIDMVI